MSLLEDVFLQDEANEAEDLERVIEGDEFEYRRRSDSDENSEKEDEAEEDKRRVDPTKPKTVRVVKNPRFLLNPARLTGPRGIQVIPDHFKDFKFKGKGYEKEDLDVVLKRLEHWAYRLYPKFQFEDCLKKIEILGKKRPVAVHLHKIRSDQFLSEDTVVQKDSSDEDTPMPVQEEDEFDKLLQQQIELARSTPVPSSAKKPTYDGSTSPKHNRTTSLMMPKATSSPSINDEQRERMLRSRKLAEERRLARLKNSANNNTVGSKEVTSTHMETDNNNDNIHSNIEQRQDISVDTEETGISRRHNRSNVIDSSDEDTAGDTCVSIEVDVHTTSKVTDDTGLEHEKLPNKIANLDNDLSDDGKVKEIENKTERSKNNVDITTTQINEGNVREQETENRDKTRNNTTPEDNRQIDKYHEKEKSDKTRNNTSHNDNRINNVSLEQTDNINDSDENVELRYDDSDMNIDDPNNESIINSEKQSEVKDAENILNGAENNGESGTEVLSTTEETKDVHNKSDDNVKNIQNVINENDPISEVVEDVMDVDFSEEF